MIVIVKSFLHILGNESLVRRSRLPSTAQHIRVRCIVHLGLIENCVVLDLDINKLNYRRLVYIGVSREPNC